MKRLLTPALLVTSLLLTGCGRNNIRYEPPVFPVPLRIFTYTRTG